MVKYVIVLFLLTYSVQFRLIEKLVFDCWKFSTDNTEVKYFLCKKCIPSKVYTADKGHNAKGFT